MLAEIKNIETIWIFGKKNTSYKYIRIPDVIHIFNEKWSQNTKPYLPFKRDALYG